MTPPTPLITGTDFITVATTDIDRAVRFYGDVQTFFEDPDGNVLAIHHRYA